MSNLNNDINKIRTSILSHLSEQPWICLVDLLTVTDSLNADDFNDTLTVLQLLTTMRQKGDIICRDVITFETNKDDLMLYAVEGETTPPPAMVSIIRLMGEAA